MTALLTDTPRPACPLCGDTGWRIQSVISEWLGGGYVLTPCDCGAAMSPLSDAVRHHDTQRIEEQPHA